MRARAVGRALLILLATLISVAGLPSAHVYAQPAPVGDGYCDPQNRYLFLVTCADEAASAGLSAQRIVQNWNPNWGDFEVIWAGAMEFFNPLDSTFEEGVAAYFLAEFGEDFMALARAGFGYTEDELAGYCLLWPDSTICAQLGPPTVEPGGDYGALMSNLGATYYDAEYGTGETGHATAHYGHPIADTAIDFDGGMTINFWVNQALGGGGSYPILSGGTNASWWVLMKQGGANGLGINVGAGSDSSRWQAFPESYDNSFGGGVEYMVTITQDGSSWSVWINGVFQATYDEAVPPATTPDFAYGWPTSVTGWGADSYRWDQDTWHLSVHDSVLTASAIEDLVEWGVNPSFFGTSYELGEFDPCPGDIFGFFCFGDEEVPAPVDDPEYDGAPTPATIPPVTPNSIPAPTEGSDNTLGDRISGFFDNLAGGISSAITWLGGLITGSFEWLGGIIQTGLDFLGNIFIYVGEVLAGLLRLILEAIKAVGLAVVTGLNAVVRAIGDIAGAVAQGVAWAFSGLGNILHDAFVPEAMTFDLPGCEDVFICAWVAEMGETIGELQLGLDGTLGGCTPPVIGWGDFDAALPAPSGCTSLNPEVDGATESAAGDLFGYRVPLRWFATLMLWLSVFVKFMRMAPWYAQTGDSPFYVDGGVRIHY